MNNTLAIYKTPFSKGYWIDAQKEFGKINRLIAAALLTAICIVLEDYEIPILPALHLSFSYIPISLCSLLTGPLMGIPCGIIADVVGAIGSPYPFFPGYTLSAVLVAVIYALYFYRQQITYSRVLLARLTVCVFVNVLIGSIWRCMTEGDFYLYYITVAGIKNFLLLPFESFIMFAVFKSLTPSLRRLRLVSPALRVTVDKRRVVIIAVAVVVSAAIFVLYSLNKSEINAALKSILT